MYRNGFIKKFSALLTAGTETFVGEKDFPSSKWTQVGGDPLIGNRSIVVTNCGKSGGQFRVSCELHFYYVPRI